MSKRKKDKLFHTEKPMTPFQFDHAVAEVFDDMVTRSIPFYDEIHSLILDLIHKNLKKGGRIYDLGCSTGTTAVLIDQALKKKKSNAEFILIDNSENMLQKCREKVKRYKTRNTQILCDDIVEAPLKKSDFVIMNYTLQFIKPSLRVKMLKKIYDSLKTGGIFIYAEKLNSKNDTVHNLFTDLYYDFKRRNGYSELEIAKKREALEKVLYPLTQEEQMKLLKKSGFKKTEMIFRWYNFGCFIGIK